MAGHADHDEDERIGTLSFPLGKQQRPAPSVVAGDICAIGRLSRAETGDTLSDKSDPLVLKPWTMPEPLLPMAVQPHAKTDEDKLAVGLQRLAAEDPTLRIEQNPETHQIVLWTMGEAHSGVVLDALSRRYGVAVDAVELRVPLRETFGGKAKGHGRHVKQSGGHGQFAVCDIEVEPLPEGSGFEFVDKVVGGAVPRNFIPSVEKGVRAQMEKGVGAGYPVVDIRVTLFDGKAHSVDSSDFAFQMAGGLALREAASATKVNLLEPVDVVSVVVPDDFVGAVMSDLAGRRGRVVGTDKVGEDRTVVKAEIPEVELTRYAIDLRSLAHGAGSFTRSFARYEPMPEHAAAKVRASPDLIALAPPITGLLTAHAPSARRIPRQLKLLTYLPMSKAIWVLAPDGLPNPKSGPNSVVRAHRRGDQCEVVLHGDHHQHPHPHVAAVGALRPAVGDLAVARVGSRPSHWESRRRCGCRGRSSSPSSLAISSG